MDVLWIRHLARIAGKPTLRGEHLERTSLGQTPAFLTNIWQGLSKTNTLAYFPFDGDGEKSSYNFWLQEGWVGRGSIKLRKNILLVPKKITKFLFNLKSVIWPLSGHFKRMFRTWEWRPTIFLMITAKFRLFKSLCNISDIYGIAIFGIIMFRSGRNRMFETFSNLKFRRIDWLSICCFLNKSGKLFGSVL
jgi:hypothetical protein